VRVCVCVCYFILFNRYWGIVTVPGFPREQTKGIKKKKSLEKRLVGSRRCINLLNLKMCCRKILRGHLREKFLEKLAPFEKLRSSGKEEARPGGGNMKQGRKKSAANHIAQINLVYDITMHFWAQLGIQHFHSNPHHSSDRLGPLFVSFSLRICISLTFFLFSWFSKTQPNPGP